MVRRERKLFLCVPGTHWWARAARGFVWVRWSAVEMGLVFSIIGLRFKTLVPRF